MVDVYKSSDIPNLMYINQIIINATLVIVRTIPKYRKGSIIPVQHPKNQ